jgi:hypothetical protein
LTDLDWIKEVSEKLQQYRSIDKIVCVAPSLKFSSAADLELEVDSTSVLKNPKDTLYLDFGQEKRSTM